MNDQLPNNTPVNPASAQSDDNVYHTFTVPSSLGVIKVAGFGQIKTITLKELTPDDELQASKRCGTNMTRLAYELAAQSLAKVNGKAVDHGASQLDVVWKGIGPKLRTLVMTAYGYVHTPPDGSGEDFLASHQVSVGG